MDKLISPLVESQLIIFGGARCQQLLPQRPLEQISVKAILDAATGRAEPVSSQQTSHGVIDQLMQQIDETLDHSFANMSLLQLVEQAKRPLDE